MGAVIERTAAIGWYSRMLSRVSKKPLHPRTSQLLVTQRKCIDLENEGLGLLEVFDFQSVMGITRSLNCGV